MHMIQYKINFLYNYLKETKVKQILSKIAETITVEYSH